MIITSLLLASLIFNFITWNQLEKIRDTQQMFAYKNEVYGLRNEIESVENNIEKIINANAWIKETSFKVNREKSSFDKVFLHGSWTFGELAKDQVPYLVLKQDKKEWKEIALSKNYGMTYGAELELSPQKQYEYKIITKGPMSKSTDIRQIPYEKYGIPKVNVKYGSTHFSSSGKVEMEFVADLDPNVPIKEMAPDEIYIEVERNGIVEKQIPFSMDDRGNNWGAQWTLKNKELLNGYKLFIVTKYKSGFTQREALEQFNNERIKF
jgi:hypothetical protein